MFFKVRNDLSLDIFSVVPPMLKYAGKTFQVRKVSEYHDFYRDLRIFYVKENDWCWTHEMGTIIHVEYL